MDMDTGAGGGIGYEEEGVNAFVDRAEEREAAGGFEVWPQAVIEIL
jgi:hypothetical protein